MRAPKEEEIAMPKFVIEREIAGAGKLPKQELQAISQNSCGGPVFLGVGQIRHAFRCNMRRSRVRGE